MSLFNPLLRGPWESYVTAKFWAKWHLIPSQSIRNECIVTPTYYTVFCITQQTSQNLIFKIIFRSNRKGCRVGHWNVWPALKCSNKYYNTFLLYILFLKCFSVYCEKWWLGKLRGQKQEKIVQNDPEGSLILIRHINDHC